MPKSRLVKIGVWEAGRFREAIIYGLGANRHLANPFGLKSTEVVELVRVALAPGRAHPTSRCVAISLKLLRRQSPDLKLVVSYADFGQGHRGTIYQAGSWLYLGASEQSYIKVRGKVEHPRTLYDRYGRNGQSIPWLRDNVGRPHRSARFVATMEQRQIWSPGTRPTHALRKVKPSCWRKARSNV